MIRNQIARVILLLALNVLGARGAVAQSGYDLFQQALVKERVDGKLDESILLLHRITREFPTDRRLVAKALLALGRNYERLEKPEAKSAYDRVLNEYADQRAQVADARTRLAVLDAKARQVGQTTRLLWGDLKRPLDYNDVGPLSPDGRYLSFTVGKEATGLAVLDLKAGKTISLTNLGDAGVEGSVESSVISPDGRQVAYLWFIWSSGVSELRVIQVNGDKSARSRIVLRNPQYLNVEGWSPDGRSVVVYREHGEPAGTGQLAVISIADGAVRVLKDSLRALGVGGASFSQDGRHVAYHRREQPNAAQDIFVVSADGRESRVVEAAGQDLHPLWAPDGSHIVFLSNRTGNMSLWMMPVAGGTSTGPARLVKANVGPFYPLGITRSGALHYVAGSDISNVYTADLDGALNAAGTPSMATNQYLNSNGAGSWSPDGQSLAYIAVTPRGALIRVRSVKTGEEREVPALIRISGPVRWFPDGQSLLVVSRDDRILNGNIAYYRMNIASGNAELLHQTASRSSVSIRPDLSADGKTIFYLETQQQPVRFDIDSRRETRLAPVGNSADASHRQSLSLAISPNGAQIAYVGAGSLVVAPTAGGEARELARFTGGSSPRERADGLGLAWSPDQRFLFYIRPEIRAIWRVPVAGGTPENIGVSMNRMRALRLHPDGRRITFDSVVDAPSELWVLENFLPRAGARP